MSPDLIPVVPFREALATWCRVAALSFGGPAGQIAVMHRIIVDEKKWVGEERFLHALNYCMLLPGPEAQQVPKYTWHGRHWELPVLASFDWRSGLIALLAFALTFV